MEEEWKVYLKENAPQLYKDMKHSISHSARWRDDKIAELKEKVAMQDFCNDKMSVYSRNWIKELAVGLGWEVSDGKI